MKANRARSKTGNFLIELVIVIAFFAVASTVCVQIFVKAHLISVGGRNLTQAVAVAQTAAEGFKAVGGDPMELAHILDGTVDGEQVQAYYSGGWERAFGYDEKGFVLTARVEGQGLKTARIAVTDGGGQIIYSMEAACYTGL